jgi:hypothetical protein
MTSTLAKSHFSAVGRLSPLEATFSRIAQWAYNAPQPLSGAFSPAQLPKVHDKHGLSDLLNSTVYDIDFYGSVPNLIHSRIQNLEEDASFLVTDLTTVVEQYD